MNEATSTNILSPTITHKARFSDYFELTKPRLSLLSVVTAMVGYLAARMQWNGSRFFFAMVGTSLCAAGVAALNQWLEADTDAKMVRTAARPLPTGKIPTGSAFVLGWGLCAAGLAFLLKLVNGQAALYALLTIICYLAVYTPAKRFSRWSTEIGAVAGAFPPLIGWAAAEGKVSPLGWILFGILLFWQIPHFMAIAWTHRHDYAAVNFPMLPVRDTKGNAVAAWSLINALALIVCSSLPWGLRVASGWYFCATVVLGAWFIFKAARFLSVENRDTAARSLFFASIIWLPLQLASLVVDRAVFF